MRGRLYYLMTLVVTFVLLSVSGLAYTTYTQRQSDRRWCELLATLDQPSPQPTTARGREIQRQIHQLRRDFDCEER